VLNDVGHRSPGRRPTGPPSRRLGRLASGLGREIVKGALGFRPIALIAGALDARDERQARRLRRGSASAAVC
jgi:hypothetical protein